MGSLQMHQWEQAKTDGYTFTGDRRETELASAQERQAEVVARLAAAREELKAAEVLTKKPSQTTMLLSTRPIKAYAKNSATSARAAKQT